VDAENRLWGDPGRPFVVTMAPLGGEGPGISYTGTNRSDAFSVASTPGFALAEAARFLAHEYMHTWIARELGGVSPDDEVSGFWLSEGFTDFYAGRALLRAGLWTPADFAAELNATLLRNASSPARFATSTEVAQRFWTDNDVQKLPYDRGHLLAVELDHRLRRRTEGRAGMDDVMQEMRAAARRLRDAPTPAYAPDLFPAILLQRYDLDVLGALAIHLDGGEPVVLQPDLYGACATVRTVEQPSFTRGFDPAATSRAGNVVAGVDPAGPAYAAGLRDGMRLIRRESGAIGDASVELAYRVDDGGTERVIRYLPAGADTVTFQRVVLWPAASSPACVALMSGG
jgi:predicted metalloprotease with PDZ domain